jgi:hypothetical protein
MRFDEFKTLLTGILEIKNSKPVLSSYHRELLKAVQTEVASFLDTSKEHSEDVPGIIFTE